MSQSQEDQGLTPSTATPSIPPPSGPLGSEATTSAAPDSPSRKGSQPSTGQSQKNGKEPPSNSKEEHAKQSQVIADKTLKAIMDRTGLSREFVILEAMLHGNMDKWMKDVVIPRLERIELALKTRPVFREVYLTQEVQTPEGSAVERQAPSITSFAEAESLKAKGKKQKRAETQRTSSKAKTQTIQKRSNPPVHGGDTFPTSLLAFLRGKD